MVVAVAPPTETRMSLGTYPTPVQELASLSGEACRLWVKRDDLTHPVYGGNKVRKLERLLGGARRRHAAAIATMGAVGSHHVLATTYFGARAGFSVHAALFPQPCTPHVLEVLQADLALGLHARAAAHPVAAALALSGAALHGAHVVPPGGSSVPGALGYVDAARELAAQVRSGALPEPDVCVVALGTGGTAAGLAAGFELEGLRTRVVGVAILTPVWGARAAVTLLARATARAAGVRLSGSRLRSRLAVDGRFVGRGYGFPTAEGADATRAAASATDLVLDPTYTAKAFACALGYVREHRARHVLYWHTLSSAPMSALLGSTPDQARIPAPFERLLQREPRARQPPHG